MKLIIFILLGFINTILCGLSYERLNFVGGCGFFIASQIWLGFAIMEYKNN